MGLPLISLQWRTAGPKKAQGSTVLVFCRPCLRGMSRLLAEPSVVIMPPFYHSATSRKKPNVLSSIHVAALLPSVAALLFLLHSSAGVTGHLTYLEAMTSGDEVEPRQEVEDFYQDYQDEDSEDYQLDQKLDLDSLQDILDYSVEVEGREELDEMEEEKFKEKEEEPNIRQFALMISRMLYQLTKM